MYSSGNASNLARLRFPPQHVQFLLALVLVLLPFSLDLAYCRSFATLWSVAVLSVSNLNNVWVQASIPHTGLAPLFTPRITGLCWRHAGTFATSSPSFGSEVFNSGKEAGDSLHPS